MQQTYERERDMGSMSKSMLIVMAFTMVGKVTGFLRETVFASQFGAGSIADALKTADQLPCIFLSIIVAALAATLIPAYSERQKHGQAQANRFISNLYTVGIAFSLLVLLITTLLLEPLVNNFLLADAEAETKALALQLARMMMPMGIFVFLARITSAYLQANFRFAVPALSQICLNVVVILSILLSAGVNVAYVAIGTVVGWILQFSVQIPSMRRAGLSYRPTFDLKEAGLREVAVLMLPVLISGSFDQIYFSFDKSIASKVTGDIAMLDYANKLSTMVSAVLLTTIATVLYPNLVRNADSREKMADNLSFGINLNLLIALPATLALILLRVPIIHLVYERGKFEATVATASILACYSAGILGVGLRELCNRTFYAYKDMKVPTLVGIGVVLLNIALNYALYPLFGAPGIAAATSVSSLLSGGVLMALLHRKRRAVDFARVLRCLWKAAAATGAMAAVLVILTSALDLYAQSGMRFYLSMLIVFAAGVGVYGVSLVLLKTEEVRMALSMVKKKMGSKGAQA